MSKQLFFQLLREARRLKNILGWNWKTRRAYLLGMMRMYLLHEEVLRVAGNMEDYWAHQRSGAD